MVALIPGYVASPMVRKAQRRVRSSDSTWGRQRCQESGAFLVWLIGIALPVDVKEAGEKEYTNLVPVCPFHSLGECLGWHGAGVGHRYLSRVAVV